MSAGIFAVLQSMFIAEISLESRKIASNFSLFLMAGNLINSLSLFVAGWMANQLSFQSSFAFLSFVAISCLVVTVLSPAQSPKQGELTLART